MDDGPTMEDEGRRWEYVIVTKRFWILMGFECFFPKAIFRLDRGDGFESAILIDTALKLQEIELLLRTLLSIASPLELFCKKEKMLHSGVQIKGELPWLGSVLFELKEILWIHTDHQHILRK